MENIDSDLVLHKKFTLYSNLVLHFLIIIAFKDFYREQSKEI